MDDKFFHFTPINILKKHKLFIDTIKVLNIDDFE